ncbi:MAG: hypothetical protein IS860_08410 [Nitrosopumilus sp.]|nr:hypothetical protein [Nitrosopumilus sp.]MCE2506851.1 hypothetical protein [Nitrosopumilaceae archaeon]
MTLPQTINWKLIRKLLQTKGQKPKISEGDESFLKKIYSSDTQKLEKLLGQKLPWSDIFCKN